VGLSTTKAFGMDELEVEIGRTVIDEDSE
jgi:hypothetical protein